MRITRSLLLACLLAFSLLAHVRLQAAVVKDSLYIVLLRDKSLVEKIMEWAPEATRSERMALLRSARAQEFLSRVGAAKRRQVERLQLRLQTLGAGEGFPVVLDQGAVAVNYLLVEGSLDQVQSLAEEMPLRGIYPVEERFLQTDSMPELLRAPEAWEVVGGVGNAGAGIKIGIIDSGLNIEHSMFNDAELVPPEGFPKGNFPGQVNQKVIVARHYVRREFGLNSQPVQNPRDERGHGSRVGGVAAGSVTETLIGTASGIAPKAFLGSYKVFGDPRINGTTTNAAVVAAINDAVADGMDIINLSLGGSARNPHNDPEQIAITNASEMGIVFTVAAGNRGAQGAGSVTSPGTAPAALTVGSTSHRRVLLPRIELMTNDVVLPDELRIVPYQPGTGQPINQITGPLQISHIADLDPTEEACSPLPAGSLQGRVALVKRGTCFFLDKLANVVTAAGAVAMLVYNNKPGRPITMKFSGEIVPEPAVMIDQERGLALSQLLRTGVLPARASSVSPQQNLVTLVMTFFPQNDQASFTAFPVTPDEHSDFSGMGPSFNRFKPDLVSTGESILSAERCLPDLPPGQCRNVFSNPGNTQGTSFSTPAVAGAAALLRQHHPLWASSWIRSAIVNSAFKTVTKDGQAATVNQAGNGRLDVYQAIHVPAVFDPLSLNFGPQDNVTEGSRAFLITNVSGQPQTYHLTVVEAVNDADVDLRIEPEMVILMPEEEATAELRFSAGSVLGSGFFEGYVDVEAHTLSPAGESAQNSRLSISFWGSLTLAIGGRVLPVAQDGSGSFTSIGSALSVALPQDIIEILDSAVYEENLVIDTDSNGIPLHGLTLRAGLAASPIIRGSGDRPVLEFRGTSEVTIQGLEIQGGDGMVRLQDATGVFRDNVLNGSETESSGILLSLSNSHFHIFGNELLGASSTAMGLFNASTSLVQQNRIGSSTQPSGQHGFFAGTQSLASLFQNVVDSSGATVVGQGMRFSSASGLLRSNLLTRGSAGFSDGILIRGTGSRVELRSNVISDFGRFGIFVLDTAELDSLGDRILNNTTSGIRAEEGASLRVQRAVLFGNQMGASLEGSEVRLTDSLLAGTQQGIQLSLGSLSLSRSTIFGHSGVGVAVQGATLEADHNIFSENAGGDVTGASAQALRFNLTDGLSVAGSNVQGQARFVDPQNFDFSLTPESDAIDRGDPTVCCLVGDLFFHQRIVDGDGDGQAVLDMGAIEFGSSWAPFLIAPVLAGNESSFVGLALANAFSEVPRDPEANVESASVSLVRLQAFDSQGQPVGEMLNLGIAPETQSAFLLGDRFPDSARWIEIRPSHSNLVSFTLLGASDLNYLDGSQLAPASADTLIVPEVQTEEGTTTLFLVNPEQEMQQISVSLTLPFGPEFNVMVPLAGRGSTVLDLSQIFPATRQGYLRVQSEGTLFALEIFGDDDSRAGLLALPEGSASDRLLGAQLASSPEIDTRINLVNRGVTTTVTLRVRGEDGARIASAQTELVSGGQFSAQASELFELGEGSVDGWLEVETDGGLILGNVVFGDPAGRSLAALPLQSQGAREFLLSHIAESNEIFTGITLLNGESSLALISVEAFDPDGVLLGRSFLILQAEEKRAFLLRELMPDIGDQSGGFLRIRSTRKILGFELFGNRTLNFLSAVPQQVVTQ